jgi:hypothetical protein
MRKRYLILTALLAFLFFAAVAAATASYRSLEYVLVGVTQLEKGKVLLISNPPEARQAFTSASASFKIASGILLASPWYGKLLTPIPPFRWHVQLMRASNELAKMGEVTIALSEDFPDISLDQTDVSALVSQLSSSYVQWEGRNQGNLDELELHVSRAQVELSDIPVWIFFKKRNQVESISKKLATLSSVIPEIRQSSSELQRVLGKNDSNPHQITILFQNSAELRPCGGFPGSFAYLNASSGTIRQFQFGPNIYKLDRPYERISGKIPPVPLQTITSFFGFVNSCSGDGFLASYSTRVMEMFSAASGTSPEGLIYVNSSILSSLLEITGPVKLPNGVVATSDTITTELTREVEQNYFKNAQNVAVNEPKSILNELIPVLLKKLSSQESAGTNVASLIQESIRAKELQFWFNDSALQASLSPLTPRDTPTPGSPWLKLVNSNLAGMKSSEKTLQNTRISVAKPVFGKFATYTVEIERTHTGDGIWPDATNRNYLEAYLPREAEITLNPKPIGGDYTVDGGLLIQNNLVPVDQAVVRIEEGADWKRVGWWATTPIGEITKYTLKFTLPTDSYSPETLTYLKQSGSKDTLEVFGKSHPVSTNLYLTKE